MIKLNSYIPKYLVQLDRDNDDIIYVSSSYFSPEGDVYVLDKRAIAPNVLPSTQSLNDLQPEKSTVYPYAFPVSLDFDSSSIVQTPSINNPPTASQYYYAPSWFERYNSTLLNSIDKEFKELTDVNTEVPEEQPETA